jgi:predicted GNAT family acetyltransferase
VGTYRNKPLTRLAKGAPCTFQLFGVCNFDWETCVWAHSNESKHGKGLGTKAEDCFGAIACSACHHEYDNGKRMTREQKQIAFENAMFKTWLYLWENELVIVNAAAA